MCRLSRLTKRGDLVSSRFAEPGLRWTRQRRAREAWAGRIALREPEASCRRAALSGSSRLHFLRPCRQGREIVRRTSEPCVRQNRVVLAVVATVKLLRRWEPAQPGGLSPTICESEGDQRNSAPGRARHKPSNHCAGKAGCLGFTCMPLCSLL